MAYAAKDIEQSERVRPRTWLRIVSERLSTVRYIFVVTIEDQLPTVNERAALEYADAVLLGWPQGESKDVRDIPEEELAAVSADIASVESCIDLFRQGEKDSDADRMAGGDQELRGKGVAGRYGQNRIRCPGIPGFPRTRNGGGGLGQGSGRGVGPSG